ncbi:glycine cleavage system aminomethyltransferase GcvT [Peribacillus psychrosaccharolyticus]|uniref:Aminomethyltransferase n=1 Tax=Peribacillus psychrosaccharolyticus TaxID=1407 RepID=A0A974NLL3_PERPY|nr:glycine cleavage system aminomethyltransferase GcvT [Peribacillus psychrosaccharolyticus]MEC2056896.1 glycine cleavage system aminomethyltransferase GcvT [Peribacillus psychrosaccharolyticus]MED3746478.1 glycine cleavage system aminomethyltransferase GcvT [Peribacillus psychrosaccharolyticus]QQS99983.1 glycine cleavage system aminomethyltransferase GcvT [Peribacillus psychrosaccharolyticus]
MTNLKRTALFDEYAASNGKTIDFGGWELPVQFSGIKNEHETVRTKAGLFDVSHMGEIEVKGPGSLSFLQKIMTNDVQKLTDGRAQYSAMCYENGGTIDDLLIYKKAADDYLVVVNASNIEKDFQWMQQNLSQDVELTNKSDDIALLALQGPLAKSILQKLSGDTDVSEISFFTFKENIDLNGKKAMVSRTGYTGEDGFEIYCNRDDAPILWQMILSAGESEGLLPIGLGARDTLRFEAGLPLYGQELSADITPIEAGIGFAVKTNKEEDFFGKAVLASQKENGAKRKLVGIEMIDRGIPRHGYAVFSRDDLIGEVTTGTQSPTLKKNVGLVLVKKEFAEVGTEVEVEIRSKRLKAKVVATPFYKRQKN